MTSFTDRVNAKVSSKPRVLIFVEAFYPGWKSGGPTQSIKNITLLLNKKFDVYIVNRSRDVNSSENYSGVVINEWTFSDKFQCQVIYLSNNWVSIKKYRDILKAVNPEHIYLNSLWNRGFSMKPLFACYFMGVLERVVLNPRGELNPNAIGFKNKRKLIYAALINKLGIAKNLKWNATNQIEAELIRQYFGSSASITILPNIPRQDHINNSFRLKKRNELKLVFLSRITPMKNLAFIIKVLKKAYSGTQIELSVYGPIRDDSYWEKCLAILSTLPDHVTVVYKGSVVPEQVLTVLECYHFFVLPTLGENFGHAIFDAWSAGLPVLISNNTPWKNLDHQHIGWDMPLDEDIWLNTVNKIGEMGDEAYSELCRSALSFAKNYSKNEELAVKVEQLFK